MINKLKAAYGEAFRIRGNVARHLPVIRRQVEAANWPDIRTCLVNGRTKFLSPKDRRQIIQILDVEYNYKPI